MTDFPIFDLVPLRARRAPARTCGSAPRSTGSAARPASWRSAAIRCPEHTIAAAWNAARAFFDLPPEEKSKAKAPYRRLSLRLSRRRRRGARQVEGRRHAARPQGEFQWRPACRAARADRSGSACLLLRRRRSGRRRRRASSSMEGLLRGDGGSRRAHHAGLRRGAELAGGPFRRRHRPAGQRAARAQLPASDARRPSPASCAPAPTPTMAA